MKKPFILLSGALLYAAGATAQSELSNFTATGRGGVSQGFVTDYQSIGINPANLGRTTNTTVAFSFIETGAGISSRSLTREQLKKFISSSDEKLSRTEKEDLARAFNNPNAINANIDVTTFGASVQLPKLGGLAINNRQRMVVHVGLNKNAADILFLGKDAPVFQEVAQDSSILISEILNPSMVQISWVNEWNVAYGNTVLNTGSFKLHAGVGYRFIEGIGVLDLQVREGRTTAYSALSPYFDISYGSIASDPTFNLQTNRGTILNPESVGKGHGWDLGISAEIGERVRAGIAVTDLGSMTWKGNLLIADDQPLAEITSEGVGSYKFFNEVANLVGSGENSIVRYEAGSSRTEKMPTKLRAGTGVLLGEKFDAGLDITVPLNDVAGNYAKSFVGLGVDYKPFSLLRLSSGLSAGAGYDLSLPLGITFVSPVYEAGIATRDLVSLFSENNPYLSAAFGFLRFRIPAVN